MIDIICRDAPGTGAGQFIKPRNYEETRAALDSIISDYRQSDKSADKREAAIAGIRKLGFSEGDAIRWLDGRRRA